MKRICRIVVLLIVALLLTGCTNTPNPKTDISTGWRNIGSHTFTISDEGCYYVVDFHFLYFADTSNGISVCLCSRPGCRHDKEDDVTKLPLCDAYLEECDLRCKLFVLGDHLYFLGSDAYGPNLYRRDTTGMNEKIVAELCEDHIKRKESVIIRDFIHVGDAVYYIADVKLLEANETSDYYTIRRIDLNTYEDQAILTGNLDLCAANQEGFLFHCYDDVEVDVSDPNYNDAVKKSKTELKFWNKQTGHTTTFLTSTLGEFGRVTAVDQKYVYYLRGSDSCTMQYNMDTGEHREIGSWMKQINGHYALRDEEKGYALYDLRTGKKLPVKLKADSISVRSVSEEAVILETNKLHPNSNRMESSTYNYVKLASLADGLQERDLLELYTYYYKEPATSVDDLK